VSDKTKYIGKSMPRVEAVDKATGRALYGADLYLPDMLYAKAVRSPYPHAKIKRLDTGPAMALDEVKAVVTAQDLPPLTDIGRALGNEGAMGIEWLRRLVLAHDKVLFEGHAVAVVAATTPEAAEMATGLVEVEYEELPIITDVLEAMQDDAPLLHDNLYTATLAEKPTRPSNIASYQEVGRGDVEKAFEEAEFVLESTYHIQRVSHGYLEPQAALARVEPDGRVTVWTTTQGIFNAQRQICAVLGLTQSRLTVVPLEVGGGFGGKTYATVESLAIMLARKSGRPVKLVLTREEAIRAAGGGAGAYATVKAAATKEGHLTACSLKLIYDIGALPNSHAPGGMRSLGPYKADNLKIESMNVVTNKLSALMYRAPGSTQGNFAVESHMDAMALALDIDPLTFREINAVDEGDDDLLGTTFGPIGLKEVLRQAAQHHAWKKPLRGRHQGRGLALGYYTGLVNTNSSAWLHVHRDGSVTVVTGHVDLTGTRTALRQIAAEELQIPLENITVQTKDTSSAPFSDHTVGSRTLYTFSLALNRACQDVLGQMKDRAAARLGVETEAVHYAEGIFQVSSDPTRSISWQELARLSVRQLGGPLTAMGSATSFHPPTFAAHIADVEVDPQTGKTRILRYTCFQDVGRAVNPDLVEGQVQGAVVQGIGWAMGEELQYEQGHLQNPTLFDYRLRTASDVPFIDTVIVEVPSPDNPYGFRSVAELPIVPVPAALANALYRATGVRLNKLPMTSEAIFRAIREHSSG
jgi:CO/xanthine dehydrogenase Mo-binding subunit